MTYRVTKRFFDTHHAWLAEGAILDDTEYNRGLAARRAEFIERVADEPEAKAEPEPENKAEPAAPVNKSERPAKRKRGRSRNRAQ